jgi:coenzyme F420-reducing hydrogenase delta subunit
LLEEIGLDKQRIQMVNLSSAMAGQFVSSSKEFSEKITKLGPNPLKNNNQQQKNREG